MLSQYTQLQQFIILSVVYQVKHFICDFPLQRGYMLNKIRPGWDFIPPLALHCSVHSVFTLMIAWMVNPSLWWVAGIDMVVHFIMDRLKAGPRYLGRYRDKTKASYWNALGFDQLIHHLTHIYIVWILVR